MKNNIKTIIMIVVSCIVLCSCSSSKQTILKSQAYSYFYQEKPTSILIMPPINRSVDVNAKEYMYSTMSSVLCQQGYYVLPPFLSIEILRRESAYDSERFINGSVKKIGEMFGADLVIFTVIHEWKKQGTNVTVDVEYIIKSTKTDAIIYNREGLLTISTYVQSTGGGIANVLASLIATAVKTVITKEVHAAQRCNTFILTEMPIGKYSSRYFKDGDDKAGAKFVKTVVQ
ncbi:MAG: DUF799 domain-containing protein [Bacteroidales bacterium]|jgi:hypothetical protein|nr:DUF799 domain-containing protein [Bacteroidales bacterium]